MAALDNRKKRHPEPRMGSFFLKFLLVSVFEYVCACLSVHHMYAGARGGQKGALDPLGLQLQMLVSCLMWVKGMEEAESSTRAARALNH